MDTVCGDHCSFYSCGNGGIWKSGAVCDEAVKKRRGKGWGMSGFFETSVFFGVFITLLSYGIGLLLKRKWKLAVFNPLLIAIVLTILFLVVCRIDYDVYHEGA